MSPVKRALALGLITSAVIAAPANAGEIVFSDEDGIHVASDDGSNERLLISPDDIPGAVAVYDPWIQPNGGSLVFSARTPAGYNGLYCGFRCAGVYKLDASGTITRLSPPAIDCQDTVLCTGLDVDARLTADGNRVFFNQVYAEPNTSGTFNSISRPFVAPAAGAGSIADAAELTGRCNGPSAYTPSPVDANDYVYVDCPDSVYGYAIRRGDTGEELVYEDAQIQDLAWRADGGALADVETGSDPGIWTLPLDGSKAPVHSVQLTFDWDNSASETEVTYVAADRVAFTYGDAIHVAPADCNCGIDGATKILDANTVSGLAWTSGTVPVPAAPTTPGGGGGGTGGGQTGGGQTGGGQVGGGQNPGNGNGGGGQVTPPAVKAGLTPKSAKLKTALKGLTVPFTASAPGKLTLTATVDAKTAKKLKLVKKGTKAVVVAGGTATLPKPGAGNAKLAFKKALVKKLGKAKSLKLTITGSFTPASGLTQNVTSTVTLNR
jgi:hypothetical protein